MMPMMRSTPPPAAATPLVAAVVIGRNEEAYIGRCLASVVEAVSGFAGAEVVFVDSRSTDRTRDVARTHPVRVVEISDAVPLSPALGRVVGQRLTRSEFVLFVDGDTEIDGHWLRAALDHMQAHPEVGGVCGKLREVYYADGQVVGGHPDCFDAAPTPEEVEDPGGNAVYRRASLDAAGSFNPFLTSYEEAELTARLRHAGYAVVRLPVVLGTHHTGLRGSLQELGRRWRDNLIRGYGQALRISVGTPFLRTHVRRQKRYLQFLAVVAAGVVAVVTSALLGRWWLLAAWVGLGAALIVAFMARSRSLTKPFLLIADWSVWSIPLVLGFLETPRDPRSLSVEQAVKPPEARRG
jgi:glycosyltransferase involved in cell wall biosynthesis